MDKVGNYVRTRALAVIDALGSIEINQDMPLTASVAYDANSRWLAATHPDFGNAVIFSWPERYINKVGGAEHCLKWPADAAEVMGIESFH